MKKLLPIFIVAIVFTACTPTMHTWSRCGHVRAYQARKHADSIYVFEPYGKWHLYNPTKPYPDTMYEFINSHSKPTE